MVQVSTSSLDGRTESKLTISKAAVGDRGNYTCRFSVSKANQRRRSPIYIFQLLSTLKRTGTNCSKKPNSITDFPENVIIFCKVILISFNNKFSSESENLFFSPSNSAPATVQLFVTKRSEFNIFPILIQWNNFLLRW